MQMYFQDIVVKLDQIYLTEDLLLLQYIGRVEFSVKEALDEFVLNIKYITREQF